MWEIPLFDLNYNEQEQKAVTQVLQSKWLTTGKQTRAFENEFAEYLGEKVHCCAVSNGTAALHLALLSKGIGPGDEVIISGLTFVADLNVIMLTGATPVLADITSLEDWNIDPKDILRKITPKTKAVIAVHYAGWPCTMETILNICRKRQIVVIEDAAHAPGASFKDKKCGTLGDIGCFSFFSNKNLSTGEGGMVSSTDKDMIQKIRLLRSHGMTSMTIDRHRGRSISYDVVLPGLNYRIDEIRSALGRVQLKKLDQANKKRRHLIKAYIRRLGSLKNLVIPWHHFPTDRTTAGHIFPILLPKVTDRTKFILALKAQGIQTSIHYPAMNQFSYYKTIINKPVPLADRISEKMVTLPLFPGLTMDALDRVCSAIEFFFQSHIDGGTTCI